MRVTRITNEFLNALAHTNRWGRVDRVLILHELRRLRRLVRDLAAARDGAMDRLLAEGREILAETKEVA